MPEAVVTDGVKGISTGEMFPHACIRKVGIVYTSWNTRVITSLVSGAISELLRQGVLSENIQLTKVSPCAMCMCTAHVVFIFERPLFFLCVAAAGGLLPSPVNTTNLPQQ